MTSLSLSQISTYLEKISGWDLEDSGRLLVKNFKFKDFKETIEFVNKISEVAEREEHHPDLKVYDYNNLEVKLTSHSDGGLTEKDFKVASEIDKL